MKEASRVGSLPVHELAALLAAVRDKQSAGKHVISLAMGDPDLRPPPAVVDALVTAVHSGNSNRYPPFGGTPELRAAFAAQIRRRYQVEFEPESEILPVIGSKEGLAHFALAFLNPGEKSLVPNPAYGMYRSATLLAGGVVQDYPLRKDADWQPDLDLIEREADSAKVLWLNYPNNPTGASASKGLFEQVIKLGLDHDMIVVHDLAYGDVYFDQDNPPPSIFQFAGARETAVEFHSLSKSFNMCGFRIGALVGNADMIAVMRRMKLNIDTGIYLPLQAAATVALATDEEWIAERNQIYARRRDLVVRAWEGLGLQARTPSAGLYVWAGVPEGVSSRDFALGLLERADVAVGPGTAYGSEGEGFLRLSLTVPDADLEEALERIAAARW